MPPRTPGKGGKEKVCSFLKTVFPEIGYLCWLKALCGRQEQQKLCSSVTIVEFPYRASQGLERIFWLYFCFPGLTSSSVQHGALFWACKEAQRSNKSEGILLFFLFLFLKAQLFWFLKRKRKRKKTTKVGIDPFPSDLNWRAVIPCLHLPGFCAVLQHLLNPVSINRTFQSYLATRNFTDKHAKTLLKETV